MSYKFQSDAPLGVDLFITASNRQPMMNALHRAYLPMQAFIAGLMVFVIAGCIAIGFLLTAWRSVARGIYRRMPDSPLYNGPVRYDVSEKGFAMFSDTAHWLAMDRVTRHPQGIFMYAGGFIHALPQEAAPAYQVDAVFEASQ